MLKKLILVFSFWFLISNFSNITSAQESRSFLVLTPYQTETELQTLSKESSRILAYLDEGEKTQTFILSLIIEQRLANLRAVGLKPKILDREPQLDRYKLFYHQQPNQGERLSDQGKIFVLTEYHTLLKLSPGKSFAREGAATEFFYIPFTGTTITLPQQPATPTLKEPTLPPPPASEPIIKPMLFILLYFGLGVILFLVLHKKGVLPTRKHQLIYFSLLLIGYFTAFLLLRPDTGADVPIPPTAVF